MVDFRSLTRLFHFILLFLTFFRTHCLYVAVLKIDNSSESSFMIWILLFCWNTPILASCCAERDDRCNTQSITFWWYDLFRSCWNELSKTQFPKRMNGRFKKQPQNGKQGKVFIFLSFFWNKGTSPFQIITTVVHFHLFFN